MIELYESQRAMRNMRKAAMQRGVVAVLDIGSSKIACLVLRFDGTEPITDDGIGSLAGQSGFRVIGAVHTGEGVTVDGAPAEGRGGWDPYDDWDGHAG